MDASNQNHIQKKPSIVKKLSREELRLAFTDSTVWTLIIANLYPLISVLQGSASAMSIVILYWVQSVLIGLVAFVRLFFIESGAKGQAIFFLMHYGFFHFVYSIFLFGFAKTTSGDMQIDGVWFASAIGLFAFHHGRSFVVHRQEYEEKMAGLDAGARQSKIFATPYLRIIPMHLAIIFGGALSTVLGGFAVALILLLLKTISDVFVHIVSHVPANKIRTLES
jgi:hypothetical protein